MIDLIRKDLPIVIRKELDTFFGTPAFYAMVEAMYSEADGLAAKAGCMRVETFDEAEIKRLVRESERIRTAADIMREYSSGKRMLQHSNIVSVVTRTSA
jgi:hypothetical protein